MKKQYFINANIIDPHNSLNENGGLIIDELGKIEAVGKKVNKNNLPSREKPTDLKEMSNILSQQGLLGKIGGDMYLIELMESVPGILPLEQEIGSLKKNYLERIEDNKNSLNL